MVRPSRRSSPSPGNTRGLRSSRGKRRNADKQVKSDLQQSVPTGHNVPNFLVNALPAGKLANAGRRRRGAPSLPRPSQHPAHSALYGDSRPIGSRISGGTKNARGHRVAKTDRKGHKNRKTRISYCGKSKASDASRGPPLSDDLDCCFDLSGCLRADRPAVATR